MCIRDRNRFGPRVGFAYTLNDRTVIRGGTGKYFADVSDQVSSWTERYGGGEINAQVAYDGRADFAGNPWNSRPQPTYDEALRIPGPVSYTHLRAHETPEHLVCRLL